MQSITKIFSPHDPLLHSEPNSAVETDRPDEAALFYNRGIPAKHIFLHTDGLDRTQIPTAQGQCRYLVSSPAALFALDGALNGVFPAGYLEAVGLCIGPDGFARDIPALSAAMRRTQNLTLRYAFLSPDESPSPADTAREAFSFVKQLRADVPCMLHGFCLRGLLTPLAQGNTALAETLKMLAALNDSSLYAEFFIA